MAGCVLLTAAGKRLHARIVDELVVVVGAGPAGLAAVWAAGRAGLDPLVVDQADSVAASWRERHDHLRLNTHRMFSHQPGARIPRRCGPFPARDEYVACLQDYAVGMRLQLGTRVHRIDRAGAGWELRLDSASLRAAHVVIATGPDAEPVMPAGRDGRLPGDRDPRWAVPQRAGNGRPGRARGGPGQLRRGPARPSGRQRRGAAVAVGAVGHEHHAAVAGRRAAAPDQRAGPPSTGSTARGSGSPMAPAALRMPSSARPATAPDSNRSQGTWSR